MVVYQPNTHVDVKGLRHTLTMAEFSGLAGQAISAVFNQ